MSRLGRILRILLINGFLYRIKIDKRLVLLSLLLFPMHGVVRLTVSQVAQVVVATATCIILNKEVLGA